MPKGLLRVAFIITVMLSAAQKQLEADLEQEAGDAGTLRLNAANRKEYDGIKARAGAQTGKMQQELAALQSALQVIILSFTSPTLLVQSICNCSAYLPSLYGHGTLHSWYDPACRTKHPEVFNGQPEGLQVACSFSRSFVLSWLTAVRMF